MATAYDREPLGGGMATGLVWLPCSFSLVLVSDLDDVDPGTASELSLAVEFIVRDTDEPDMVAESSLR